MGALAEFVLALGPRLMFPGSESTATMTAPKRQRKAGGGRPKAPERKVPITGFRGSPNFKDWFEGLVKFTRLPASSIIELSVIRWAKEEAGYGPEAPER